MKDFPFLFPNFVAQQLCCTVHTDLYACGDVSLSFLLEIFLYLLGFLDLFELLDLFLFFFFFFFSLEDDDIIGEIIDELEDEMVDELTSLLELSDENSMLSCLKNVIFVFFTLRSGCSLELAGFYLTSVGPAGSSLTALEPWF